MKIVSLSSVAASYLLFDQFKEAFGKTQYSEWLQPILWCTLASLALIRVPWYKNWAKELKALPKFFLSVLFFSVAISSEVIMVHFATVILGLDWHE